MHDIPPDEAGRWQALEDGYRSVMAAYGYREIRMPVVEKTDLFVRTIGEVTDIVEKEMYTFSDRNGDSLTLRPEGTAGCVRACIEGGLLQQQQRLWYRGPMYRHERPQKGRYREFYQFGAEAYGMAGPDIDAELIVMTARLWRELGIPMPVLEINSLGTAAVRAEYREKLVAYLEGRKADLDEESRRRLVRNPMRILDSKNEAMGTLINEAPKLIDHLDSVSEHHFAGLQDRLTMVGVPFRINPVLVRGLDYYDRTVFEWVSEGLGAQATVCAGGRYDGLIEQLGGKATPAAGFALGAERLIALMAGTERQVASDPHVFIIAVGETAERTALVMAERLRDETKGLRVQMNCGGGSFKSQFKKADRSGAQIALVLGEAELAGDSVGIKFLRSDRAQETVSMTGLSAMVGANIEL